MRLIAILFIALALVGVATATTYCTSYTAEDWNFSREFMYMEFGLNDGGGDPVYYWGVYNNDWTNADLYTYYEDSGAFYYNYAMLNQAPISGGKNMTYVERVTDSAGGFVPTANWTCTSNHSAMWGPSYGEFRGNDGNIRSLDRDLEVYVHYSAPIDTSYFRYIYFIKNTGTTTKRARLWNVFWTNEYGTDISPITNEQRYYTSFAYGPNDNGMNNDNPALTAYKPSSIHVQGQNALDKTPFVYGDMDNYLVGTVYTTVLAAGEEVAHMVILSEGTNMTTSLKNAADIDAEPAYIFHALTADQLAMIRNWGGCQAIIGPTATVTVTPPAQCSTTGLTSDFTVQANSTRTDLTTGFTHRVVGIQNIELVAAQSSTTLSVPNGAGAVRHQLWYKGCLVKETAFTACARPTPPVSAPVVATVPVANTPTTKSDSSSLVVVSVLSLVGVVALL